MMSRERLRAERIWTGMGGAMSPDSVIVVRAKVEPKRKKPAGRTYYHPKPYVPPFLRPRRQKILAWRSWEHSAIGAAA